MGSLLKEFWAFLRKKWWLARPASIVDSRQCTVTTPEQTSL